MYRNAQYIEYSEAYQLHLAELNRQKSAELDAISAQTTEVLDANLKEGTPLPDPQPFFAQHDQQRDQILEKYRQLVAEAHAQYHVPVLQSWRKALAETGKAVFHNEQPLPEGQRIEATLLQDGDEITFLYQEVYISPVSGFLHAHMNFRGVHGDTWEAVVQAQTLKMALNNEEASQHTRPIKLG